MHKNATLVWRAKDHPRTTILISEGINNNVNRLMNSIFGERRTNRLTISNGKYFYKPSDEYKEFAVRYKRVK